MRTCALPALLRLRQLSDRAVCVCVSLDVPLQIAVLGLVNAAAEAKDARSFAGEPEP